MEPFVAIDFETSHRKRNSACSVALVRVEGGRVVGSASRLIRPPQREILFTSIHGITWRDVADAPTFGPVWREVSSLLEGASFLAAHNASFDRSVLRASCEAAGLDMPALPWVCTVQLARKTWNLKPARLPDVARHIDFPLQHHDALSDASCCAQIVVRAHQDGGPR